MRAKRADADQRVLALVGSEDDASLARSAAEKADVEICFVQSMLELARAISGGAGAALLADEMLDEEFNELRETLDRQRQWSELPVIVLFREQAPPAEMLEEFELHSRVKVMLLHRPVPVIALASALRSALKSRLRQYEVRNLLSRLNKDVRLRDQFLAMLGHELRNPLNSIGYVAEIFGMSGEALTREQARWGADVIGRQLRHLSRLLDQLLDVARVQRGKISLDGVIVDMCALVRRCAESFDAFAKHRSFLTAVPIRPVYVRGDPLRLMQIAESLLDNAYKYTDDGGCISLVLAANHEAVLTVADDGYGIGPSAMPHVFEPFFQESRTRSQGTRGLGLGLAMVENLARLHGGRVSARSAGSGRGSVFELCLPRLPDAALEAAGEAVAELEQAPRKRPLCVLVIEDDADSADAFALLLRSLGHEVHVAYNGSAGLAELEQYAADVAFIDIELPDISGEEVARAVRERYAEHAPRLVALTGKVQSKDRGVFDEVVLKPVRREQVERLCTRYG